MLIGIFLEDIYFKGGGEKVATNLANYFVTRFNYDVTIISLSSSKSKPIYKLDEKVKIHFLKIPEDNSINKIFNRVRSVFRTRSYFGEHFYDIVLGIGTFPSILLANIDKRVNIIKVGCEHNSYISVSYFWKKLREIFYPRLNYVISLTEKDRLSLLKLNPNVFVIPNSHSLEIQEYARLDKKEILAVGRFCYQKGYDLMLEVFHKFSNLNADWNLRIIGDGPLKKFVLNKIKIKKLEERVKILPFTSDILSEYLNSSVFLLTSRYEGLPMVLLEAQACGLPIVAFNCNTGPADIVSNQQDGCLIDCFNIEKMVDALLDLTKDEEKLKKFGLQAIKNSQKFSDDIVYRKWEELFKKIVH